MVHIDYKTQVSSVSRGTDPEWEKWWYDIYNVSISYDPLWKNCDGYNLLKILDELDPRMQIGDDLNPFVTINRDILRWGFFIYVVDNKRYYVTRNGVKPPKY